MMQNVARADADLDVDEFDAGLDDVEEQLQDLQDVFYELEEQGTSLSDDPSDSGAELQAIRSRMVEIVTEAQNLYNSVSVSSQSYLDTQGLNPSQWDLTWEYAS